MTEIIKRALSQDLLTGQESTPSADKCAMANQNQNLHQDTLARAILQQEPNRIPNNLFESLTLDI